MSRRPRRCAAWERWQEAELRASEARRGPPRHRTPPFLPADESSIERMDRHAARRDAERDATEARDAAQVCHCGLDHCEGRLCEAAGCTRPSTGRRRRPPYQHRCAQHHEEPSR